MARKQKEEDRAGFHNPLHVHVHKAHLSKLYHLPGAPPWDHAFNIRVFEDIQDSNHSNHHLSFGEDGDAA
jgi:hypothetical protein